jgi:uncharacterized protein (DUF58 family)
MSTRFPPQRLLDPAVLGRLSNLELIAKTVVQGYINGLHRSPDFGFSQEFAEYRMYSPGDDLRHVDWNVFARTERAYLKRYRGETNTQLTILFDLSASMNYGTLTHTKLDYARMLAASLAWMASQQRDAAGIIAFDDAVQQYVPPSSRQGQLVRVLHALEHLQAGKRTDFATPARYFQQFLVRKGLVVVISDFYEEPSAVMKTFAPLAWHGNEVVLFHVLDPGELKPELRGPALLEDLETGETIEVTPQYARTEYAARMQRHLDELQHEARSTGMSWQLLRTSDPLDEALRSYLNARQRKL